MPRLPRTFAGDPERSRIVTAALFVPFVLVVALLGYTLDNERSRREVERQVLADYSRLAGIELARVISEELHQQVTSALAAPMASAMGRGRKPDLMDPEQLLRPPDLSAMPAMARCFICDDVRAAFRLDRSSGRLVAAGTTDTAGVAAVLAAAGGEMGEPHRVVADSVDGHMRILAAYTVRDTIRRNVVTYAVDLAPAALGIIVGKVLREHALVSSSVGKPPYTAATLRVAVLSARGAILWQNAPLNHEAAGVDSLPSYLGRLRVAAEAGPAMATALRIGRPSPLYLPVLFALLALSAALAILAMLQLRRAREVSRLRTRFVANVSHELRTPLAHMSMYAEMLALGRERDAAERRRFAAIIQREVARLGTLVEGVMRFARSQETGGRDAVQLEPRSMASEVRDAVDFFHLVASGKETRIEVTVVDEPTVNVDPAALRQVILNLLDNCVKYGPRGQTVAVRILATASEALLEITDQGPGIPATDRERVFAPYTRLESTDHPRVAGAGIGLAVVRELVRALGGEVRFVGSDTGARVLVIFPVASASSAPAGPPAPAGIGQ